MKRQMDDVQHWQTVVLNRSRGGELELRFRVKDLGYRV